jgi:hypothetical protein
VTTKARPASRSVAPASGSGSGSSTRTPVIGQAADQFTVLLHRGPLDPCSGDGGADAFDGGQLRFGGVQQDGHRSVGAGELLGGGRSDMADTERDDEPGDGSVPGGVDPCHQVPSGDLAPTLETREILGAEPEDVDGALHQTGVDQQVWMVL